MSLMADEIAECPVVAADFLNHAGIVEMIAGRLRAADIAFVVVCGRGSSGHAGVYLRYLVETSLGFAVSAAAPSIVTGYRRTPRLGHALFIVISQSGRSPDLVSATAAAREAGALTLALVNDPDSPVANAAELVLPLRAGVERSVAATKTVVNSLLASALLVARWSGDETLEAAARRLPGRLVDALTLDWLAWGKALAVARAAFVVGRGHGLGIAREVALKLAETLQLPALAYSSAELRHGPRAAVTAATPVLALRQQDAVAGDIDGLVGDLRGDGVPVAVCGGPLGTLPWICDDAPAIDPIAMLLPAYLAIEGAARYAGLDPDAPPGLRKVTETL